MLSLFGLVLDLRCLDLLPRQELPDAPSVVLVPQSVQEDIDGGAGLGQDGSHLQRRRQHEFKRATLTSKVKMLDGPHHPELWRDQVGVLHSGVKGQNAVGPPAQKHGFQRGVGIELRDEEGGGGKKGKKSTERCS